MAPLWKSSGLILSVALVVAGSSVSGASPAGRERGARDAAPTPAGPRVEGGFGRLPLAFFEDPFGGADSYLAQGSQATVRVAPGAISLLLAARPQARPDVQPAARPRLDGVPMGKRGPASFETVDLSFTGRAVRPVPEAIGPGTVSYFRGSPEQWRTGLRTYERLRYPDVWPGIDVLVFGQQDRLAYAFEVRPGADPSRIGLSVAGARVSVTSEGGLRLATGSAELLGPAPVAYQETAGRRVAVQASYQAAAPQGGASYGVRVGRYDSSRPLVVEPAFFVYAGFIGGPGDDRGLGIAVDSTGAAYVTGHGPSPANGFQDAYVVKVRPDGTGFLYAAFIAGDRNDQAFDIVVDAQGFAYVTGATDSFHGTFPVVNGPDLTYNGTLDAFVCKLTPRGTRLAFCGYLGGNLADFGEGIALDADNNVYVEGPVESNEGSFPAKVGPDVTFNGSFDAFVAKVRAFPNAPNVKDNLFYAGYIGGSGADIGAGPTFLTSGHIDVDDQGHMYVSGETTSTQATFPDGDGFGSLPGPDRTHNGGWDAWVAKVAADGTGLVYAGYIGGSGEDFGFGMAVDPEGNAYLTGHTESTEATFPVTVGPDLTYNGEFDGFVAKVNAAGTALVYAGYVGGARLDQGLGVAVDAAGHLFVIGHVESDQTTFPVIGGPDLTFNGGVGDAYLAKLVPLPSDPVPRNNYVYNGYIGGENDEAAFWVALDPAGAAYVPGDTRSTQSTFPDGDGFGPLPGPDQTHNGRFDGFVVKIAE